jgi:hypothetical protein
MELYNEFETTISYKVVVNGMGISAGKDRTGQVIDPPEGVNYDITEFRIAGKTFKVDKTGIPEQLKIATSIFSEIVDHSVEHLGAMIEEEQNDRRCE